MQEKNGKRLDDIEYFQSHQLRISDRETMASKLIWYYVNMTHIQNERGKKCARRHRIYLHTMAIPMFVKLLRFSVLTRISMIQCDEVALSLLLFRIHWRCLTLLSLLLLLLMLLLRSLVHVEG